MLSYCVGVVFADNTNLVKKSSSLNFMKRKIVHKFVAFLFDKLVTHTVINLLLVFKSFF